MEHNSNLSIQELEEALTSNADCIEFEKSVADSLNSKNIKLVKCLVCSNEFNCSDAGTDPINQFCTLCNATMSS
jgi:hypothetical protein